VSEPLTEWVEERESRAWVREAYVRSGVAVRIGGE
jgi:hypothetical protein